MISVNATAVEDQHHDTLVSSDEHEFISEGEVEVEELQRGNEGASSKAGEEEAGEETQADEAPSQVFDDGTMTYFWYVPFPFCES